MIITARAAQAIMHCSALRRALAALGGDGSAGEELVELLAGSEGGQGLAGLVSPAMLREVLRAEADTAVLAMRNAQPTTGP